MLCIRGFVRTPLRVHGRSDSSPVFCRLLSQRVVRRFVSVSIDPLSSRGLPFCLGFAWSGIFPALLETPSRGLLRHFEQTISAALTGFGDSFLGLLDLRECRSRSWASPLE